ncbi:nucleoid-associated protein YejK [Pseudomonas sp.]|jgi:nucleoid-associated protein|uniref:nucleoid-associated protein YejK n=1 Tax=Pseudomonas sp. TaxID=306 RepID=UPI002EDAB375
MPVKNAIVHLIDKKPDGLPAIVHLNNAAIPESDALDNLSFDLNDAYNAKANKGWGLFHAESGAFPFSGWLRAWMDLQIDFVAFTRRATEHLTQLLEESNLSTGGHVLFAHYQQGMTEYLAIAVLLQSEGVTLNAELQIEATRYLDVGKLHLACRINLSEWRQNAKSRQYISFLKSKNGRKNGDYFRDFIGCQEAIDAPSETRTLLKAFTDFVEAEDMGEEQAREATGNLVAYTSDTARKGEAITLDELSEMIDGDSPKSFANFIRDKDYGLSDTIPADKRVINQFRRFTGRSEGLSISFEAHHLGNRIEFDQTNGTLTIRNVPTALVEQLKRADK